ncbi:MAG: hypothetical protein ABIR96_07665, partial [Bdellovibrionota bacterium]
MLRVKFFASFFGLVTLLTVCTSTADAANFKFAYVAKPPKNYMNPRAQTGRLDAVSEFFRGRSADRFAVLYFDENAPRSEIFEIKADGWQDRIDSRVWTNAEAAKNYLTALGFSSTDEAQIHSEFGETVQTRSVHALAG